MSNSNGTITMFLALGGNGIGKGLHEVLHVILKMEMQALHNWTNS